MNLHGLRVFYTVATQRSFSLAAEALYISQPAVSKAVRELEHTIGLALVERAGKGKTIRLTEAGQALLEHATGIFAIEAAAEQDLKARAGLTRGQLNIGASTTVASYWLTHLLAQFNRAHPDIDITLNVANSSHIEQALLQNDIELGYVEGKIAHPLINCEHWKSESLSVFCGGAIAQQEASSEALERATLAGQGTGFRYPQCQRPVFCGPSNNTVTHYYPGQQRSYCSCYCCRHGHRLITGCSGRPADGY